MEMSISGGPIQDPRPDHSPPPGECTRAGRLWSSMTLAENIALPLETYTDLSPGQIREVVN